MNLAEVPSETELEVGGHVKGVAVAVVRQNKDESGLARVKVNYPWHSQPRESYWARVASPMTGGNRGMYFLPEVGDEVLVAFERGDLRFPYIVGSLWNGVDKSPQANKDGRNDLRVIHTRKGHKLTFDDGTRGKVQLELDDGKRVTLDDDGIVIDDGKGNKVVIKSASGEISLEAATKLSLKAPQITIEATASGTVKAGGTLEVSGALVKIN
jgi:uncharacterized protein involved in type VI secretion and phage assembly